jgi:hypothetical protein
LLSSPALQHDLVSMRVLGILGALGVIKSIAKM